MGHAEQLANLAASIKAAAADGTITWGERIAIGRQAVSLVLEILQDVMADGRFDLEDVKGLARDALQLAQVLLTAA